MSNILAELADELLEMKIYTHIYAMIECKSKHCACEYMVEFHAQKSQQWALPAHKKQREQKLNHARFLLDNKWLKYTKNPINFDGIVFVSDVNFKTNGAKHFRAGVCECNSMITHQAQKKSHDDEPMPNYTPATARVFRIQYKITRHVARSMSIDF